MKKINTYGYMAVRHKNLHIPLHIVEICSTLVHGISVFSSATEAINYIRSEKEDLQKYGIDITYDDNFDFAENIILCYQNTEKLFSDIENKQLYIAY